MVLTRSSYSILGTPLTSPVPNPDKINQSITPRSSLNSRRLSSSSVSSTYLKRNSLTNSNSNNNSSSSSSSSSSSCLRFDSSNSLNLLINNDQSTPKNVSSNDLKSSSQNPPKTKTPLKKAPITSTGRRRALLSIDTNRASLSLNRNSNVEEGEGEKSFAGGSSSSSSLSSPLSGLSSPLSPLSDELNSPNHNENNTNSNALIENNKNINQPSSPPSNSSPSKLLFSKPPPSQSPKASEDVKDSQEGVKEEDEGLIESNPDPIRENCKDSLEGASAEEDKALDRSNSDRISIEEDKDEGFRLDHYISYVPLNYDVNPSTTTTTTTIVENPLSAITTPIVVPSNALTNPDAHSNLQRPSMDREQTKKAHPKDLDGFDSFNLIEPLEQEVQIREETRAIESQLLSFDDPPSNGSNLISNFRGGGEGGDSFGNVKDDNSNSSGESSSSKNSSLCNSSTLGVMDRKLEEADKEEEEEVGQSCKMDIDEVSVKVEAKLETLDEIVLDDHHDLQPLGIDRSREDDIDKADEGLSGPEKENKDVGPQEPVQVEIDEEICDLDRRDLGVVTPIEVQGVNEDLSLNDRNAEPLSKNVIDGDSQVEVRDGDGGFSGGECSSALGRDESHEGSQKSQEEKEVLEALQVVQQSENNDHGSQKIQQDESEDSLESKNEIGKDLPKTQNENDEGSQKSPNENDQGEEETLRVERSESGKELAKEKDSLSTTVTNSEESSEPLNEVSNFSFETLKRKTEDELRGDEKSESVTPKGGSSELDLGMAKPNSNDGCEDEKNGGFSSNGESSMNSNGNSEEEVMKELVLNGKDNEDEDDDQSSSDSDESSSSSSSSSSSEDDSSSSPSSSSSEDSDSDSSETSDSDSDSSESKLKDLLELAKRRFRERSIETGSSKTIAEEYSKEDSEEDYLNLLNISDDKSFKDDLRLKTKDGILSRPLKPIREIEGKSFNNNNTKNKRGGERDFRVKKEEEKLKMIKFLKDGYVNGDGGKKVKGKDGSFGWNDLPRQEVDDYVKKEFRAMRLQRTLDPQKFIKSSDRSTISGGGKGKGDGIPEKFLFGHVIDGVGNSQGKRKMSFVDGLLEEDKKLGQKKMKMRFEEDDGVGKTDSKKKNKRGGFGQSHGGGKKKEESYVRVKFEEEVSRNLGRQHSSKSSGKKFGRKKKV